MPCRARGEEVSGDGRNTVPLDRLGSCCNTHGSGREGTYLQLALIDQCFQHADASGSYTHFIRARPDFAFYRPFPAEVLDAADTVTTAVKTDAPVNDQFFVVPEGMKRSWWDALNLTCEGVPDCCPEYAKFNGISVRQDHGIRAGLVRRGSAQKGLGLACWRGGLPDDGECNPSQVMGLEGELLSAASACPAGPTEMVLDEVGEIVRRERDDYMRWAHASTHNVRFEAGSE